MAWIEAGYGDPIVFLHGNPTSSFLWRNVKPHLQPHGRCIAPDLIGMGDSGKLPASGAGSYRFAEHRRYLDALLEQLEVTERVTLVVHDWGSALGFDWASRHRHAVAGIAYMEAIVRPFTWAQWPEPAWGIFKALRSPAGEDMILQRNLFIETRAPPAPASDAAPSSRLIEAAPRCEDPLSTIQNTRSTPEYGSAVIICSTSRENGAIPVVWSHRRVTRPQLTYQPAR